MEHHPLTQESDASPELHASTEPEKLGDILVRTSLIAEAVSSDEQQSAEAPVKKPDAILRKVLEAAERNNPLERLYELRHEIKDQTSEEGSLEQVVAAQIATVKNDAAILPNKGQQPLIDSLMRSSVLRQKYIRYAWNGIYIAMGIIIIMLLFLIAS